MLFFIWAGIILDLRFIVTQNGNRTIRSTGIINEAGQQFL